MRSLWRRWRARWGKPVVELESVRRRLGFVLHAMYDRELVLAGGRLVPSTLGDTIYLPHRLDARTGRDAAERRYRLLALEQAERIMRGTAQEAPPSADLLERDLYWLSEAAAVDASLSRTMPGMRPLLMTARAAALEQRPTLGRLRPIERDVEMLIRGVLEGDPGMGPHTTAAESVAWARAKAEGIRARHGASSRYRATRPVELWGTVSTVGPYYAQNEMDAIRHQIDLPIRGTRTGAAQADADSEGPVGFAEKEITTNAPGDSSAPPPASRPDLSIPYPEWDVYQGQYRQNAALVQVSRAEESDAASSAEPHTPLVRRVRQRFEMLRARRTRLAQQRDGDDLDLSACVRAQVDLRTTGGVDDRLYLSTRPARRRIGIALLADVSGSTEAQVTAAQQVIDVEKVALLLAGEALDALGDPYTILTFASSGARDVRVTTIKDFREPNGDAVRRRIAAIRPAGNTRMGAAVRHATALLVGQRVGHRLLLILSDGRPNDHEGYYEPYGVEDTRQAILEARASDVFPFCLTVDREGAEYLPHIFGAAGHTILRHADQLPQALLQVVLNTLRG